MFFVGTCVIINCGGTIQSLQPVGSQGRRLYISESLGEYPSVDDGHVGIHLADFDDGGRGGESDCVFNAGDPSEVSVKARAVAARW